MDRGAHTQTSHQQGERQSNAACRDGVSRGQEESREEVLVDCSPGKDIVCNVSGMRELIECQMGEWLSVLAQEEFLDKQKRWGKGCVNPC